MLRLINFQTTRECYPTTVSKNGLCGRLIAEVKVDEKEVQVGQKNYFFSHFCCTADQLHPSICSLTLKCFNAFLGAHV